MTRPLTKSRREPANATEAAGFRWIGVVSSAPLTAVPLDKRGEQMELNILNGV